MFQLHCLTFEKKSWNQWSISNTSSSQIFSEKKKEFMTWNFCQLKKQFSRFIRYLILAVWNLCNIYNEWFCNEFLCAKKSLNSAEKKLFSIKICCISKRFWKETLSVKLVIIQKIDNVKKLHFCEGPPSPNHKSSSWKLKKKMFNKRSEQKKDNILMKSIQKSCLYFAYYQNGHILHILREISWCCNFFLKCFIRTISKTKCFLF